MEDFPWPPYNLFRTILDSNYSKKKMLSQYRHQLLFLKTSRPWFVTSKRHKFDMREKVVKFSHVFFVQYKTVKFIYNFQDLWKKTHTQLALDNFDGMYGAFYGNKLWPSIRLSILSQPKYCALVNYYGDYEATIQMLKVS